ncbi:KTSC domain-containing protein [Natronoarchaeum rubrum]|uniref:KTSC domain-containing protein n=1 Tax=Natronoarchaeum rubrum TaxID=755311 RepID=UPI0021115B93|nr:KTSC domain-containing protein [Natronoarchaeum rubrum]
MSTNPGGIPHPEPTQFQAPGRGDPTDIRAPLDMESFNSSNVHSALYDFGTEDLYVRYDRTGPDAIYAYRFVPASEWDGLASAGSAGSYINENIAYGYPYELLTKGDFPQMGRGLENDLARRFVTQF